MSLHEKSDGRDPKREHSDHYVDAEADGRSDREETRYAAPSNGGPDVAAASDEGGPAGEHDSPLSSLAVDDGDVESASPDRIVASTLLSERTVSLYVSLQEGSTSNTDNACIGMQSRMGPSRTERQSTRVSGATSDIAAWRAKTEGDDSEGHHPASAQTTGYLVSRR